MQPPELSPSLRHGAFEDAQALFAGTLFVAMALMLFNQAGLLVGGTAGVAFLLHYVTDVSFGKLFFAVNLPFYWFAWTRMGREFTIKTFVCVGLLSLLTELFPHVMHVDYLNPLFASVLGGLLLGTGCLFLARHRSSLGGATVVSLYCKAATACGRARCRWPSTAPWCCWPFSSFRWSAWRIPCWPCW